MGDLAMGRMFAHEMASIWNVVFSHDFERLSFFCFWDMGCMLAPRKRGVSRFDSSYVGSDKRFRTEIAIVRNRQVQNRIRRGVQ
jgi:hypothetical protein